VTIKHTSQSIFCMSIIILNIIYCSRCRKIDETPTLICNHSECLIDPSLLDAIRNQSRQFGWSAKNYSEFWGRTYDDGLKWRLGTLQQPEKVGGTSIFVQSYIKNFIVFVRHHDFMTIHYV